ncbi:MAG: hypothetical protein AABY15_06195 [Nanoarchaeota archaeon]
MVFLEIVVMGLAIWQGYDLFFENALEKRLRKYNGYATKEVLEDPRTNSDFISIFVFSIVGWIIEVLVLIYLATKKYLFPFSLITLALFVFIFVVGIFIKSLKKRKQKDTDEKRIQYHKPNLLNKIFRKVSGTYVLGYYLMILYVLFI